MIQNKDNKINLYRVNEHNEAFYCWQKARHEGIIDSSVDLFHIDAHADMGRPHLFRNPLYTAPGVEPLAYFKKFSREELTIGNFIFPAVLSGLVRNVYFFYPEWRKFRPTRGRVRIASAFGEGKIIKYPGRLNTSGNKKTLNNALPDMKTFSYFSLPIERMPRKRKIILDIDLDYFACRDTTQNNWKYSLAITPEQYQQAESFLKDATIPFSGLEFTFKIDDQQPVVDISFRKIEDKSYLPDREKIAAAVDQLATTLAKQSIRPVVITLCRSRISGFCPSEYVDFIETILVKRLSEEYSLYDSLTSLEMN